MPIKRWTAGSIIDLSYIPISYLSKPSLNFLNLQPFDFFHSKITLYYWGTDGSVYCFFPISRCLERIENNARQIKEALARDGSEVGIVSGCDKKFWPLAWGIISLLQGYGICRPCLSCLHCLLDKTLITDFLRHFPVLCHPTLPWKGIIIFFSFVRLFGTLNPLSPLLSLVCWHWCWPDGANMNEKFRGICFFAATVSEFNFFCRLAPGCIFWMIWILNGMNSEQPSFDDLLLSRSLTCMSDNMTHLGQN